MNDHNKKKPKYKTVQPPFQNLESFNATAVILSYAMYHDQVDLFLTRLSKNASDYQRRHSKILKEFMIADPNPPTLKVKEFGDTKCKWVQEFPNADEWRQIKYNKNMKIKQIKILEFN